MTTNPWPWRGWVATWVFMVLNAAGTFVMGMVAAFAGSGRLADVTFMCLFTAVVCAVGLGTWSENRPRRAVGRAQRAELAAARRRAEVAQEIRRLEGEVWE